MNRRLATALATSGALIAAGGGALVGTAIAQEIGGEVTRTVTVDVGAGEQGPAGPPGPAGPAGPPGPTPECGAGYTWSVVVFNAPGGQETIKTCLKNAP